MYLNKTYLSGPDIYHDNFIQFNIYTYYICVWADNEKKTDIYFFNILFYVLYNNNNNNSFGWQEGE